MYYPDENGSPSNSDSEPSEEHEDLFRNKVQAFWQEECFVDVTLACDDKILTAHKLVLSAYSDYFKRIFSSLKYNQHPVVFMKDISFEVLQAVLEFMYCGEVNVAHYNLKSFMNTARSLKIKGLSMDRDNEEERESPHKRKRTNQGSPNDNQQMMHTPPGKKRKTFPGQEQKYFDDDDDDIGSENDSQWDEDGPSMPHNYGKRVKYPPKQRPHQHGFSQHRYENEGSLHERKRNNSFGNSSHSSQQSRSSFKPVPAHTTFSGRVPVVYPNSGRSRPRVKDDPIRQVPISDQNHSDNEEMEENNLDESFSKNSPTSNSKSQNASRMIVESSQDSKKQVPIKGELFSKPEIESRLTRFIVYMSQNTPLTINQVKSLAWALDSVYGGDKFDSSGPSTNWWVSFQKKYPKMKNILRNHDFLKANHLSSTKFSFKTHGVYLTPVREIIEAFNLNKSPENFWSCGEYSIKLSNPLTSGKEVLFPGRERFTKKSDFSSEEDFASIMICGSASGEKLVPFAVFKNFAPDEDHTRHGPSDAMYDQNSSGFFDSDTLLRWFEDCFLPRCPESRSEDNPVILLMNSLLPLVSQEMLDMALAENVILLSLMPHLHHACQPMDVSFVKGFRKSMKEKIETNAVYGAELKDAIPSFLTDAYSKKVTPNLLKDGFRICGVFPLSLTVCQDEYMTLASNLGFNQLVSTGLEIESKESEKRPNKRISKLPKKHPDEMNTSDEEEIFGEDSSSCYVCGKEYNSEEKEGEEKWLKCSKKHCNNYACKECLPTNFELAEEFFCIDCKKA